MASKTSKYLSAAACLAAGFNYALQTKKDTFRYVKKVSCRAVNISLRCDPSSFTAFA